MLSIGYNMGRSVGMESGHRLKTQLQQITHSEHDTETDSAPQPASRTSKCPLLIPYKTIQYACYITDHIRNNIRTSEQLHHDPDDNGGYHRITHSHYTILMACLTVSSILFYNLFHFLGRQLLHIRDREDLRKKVSILVTFVDHLVQRLLDICPDRVRKTSSIYFSPIVNRSISQPAFSKE